MEAELGNLSVPLAFVSVVAPALLRSQHTLGLPSGTDPRQVWGSRGPALMRLIPPPASQHPQPLPLPGNLVAGPVPAASLTPVLF